MSHTKNMKISNCLKLVLLCGCPPDNSNYQLQLGQQEECVEEESDRSRLYTENQENCSRSDLHCSKSIDSLQVRQMLKNRCYTSNENSDIPANCVQDVSYQDEQKAIALILEYLKMKHQPKSPKDGGGQHYSADPPPSQPNNGILKKAESKWRGRKFKKSISLFDRTEAPKVTGVKEMKTRAKSFQLITSKRKMKSKENISGPQTDNIPEEIEIEKEYVKSPKLKAPLSFFKRLTSQTVMQSRTIVETTDLEIKEITLSEKKGLNPIEEITSSEKKGLNPIEEITLSEKKGFNQRSATKESFGMRRMESKNQLKNKNNKLDVPTNRKDNMSTKGTLLSPNVGVVLNPNILDEVAPYVLRFVKNYLGDFRRYLLDAFIGVDSISVDYFESMVKAIDNFPIDDLTLFKNIKYTLALLFQEEQENLIDQSLNNTHETVSSKYQEKLKRTQIVQPPVSYRYTIKNRKPINYDNRSMGDLPAFLVRYYPDGNKVHRNQYSQTEVNSSRSK